MPRFAKLAFPWRGDITHCAAIAAYIAAQSVGERVDVGILIVHHRHEARHFIQSNHGHAHLTFAASSFASGDDDWCVWGGTWRLMSRY